MIVRPATEADLEAVSALTRDAYVGDGLVPEHSPYVEELTNVNARLVDGGLLVAEVDGAVVGAVTVAVHGSPYAEICDPGEAEFRMLAVAPSARQRGVGRVLIQECIRRALDNGAAVLRLCTQDAMAAAQRLYEQMGFRRTPDRDWAPAPGVALLAFELGLRAYDDGGTELEPPRRCGACGRRMVVQVTPQGWTAKCSVHGLRHS